MLISAERAKDATGSPWKGILLAISCKVRDNEFIFKSRNCPQSSNEIDRRKDAIDAYIVADRSQCSRMT
jgi:hypothetical protein